MQNTFSDYPLYMYEPHLFLEKYRVEPQELLNFLDSFFIHYHFKDKQLAGKLLSAILENPHTCGIDVHHPKFLSFIISNFSLDILTTIPQVTIDIQLLDSLVRCNKGDYTSILNFFIPYVGANNVFNYKYIHSLSHVLCVVDRVDRSVLNKEFFKKFIIYQNFFADSEQNKKIQYYLDFFQIKFSLTDIFLFLKKSIHAVDFVTYNTITDKIESYAIKDFLNLCNSGILPQSNNIDELQAVYERYMVEQHTQPHITYLAKKGLSKDYEEFLNKINVSKL